MSLPLKKPSIEEWLHWAEVIVARLTDAVHVYKKEPSLDAFMSLADRQHKSDILIKLLHRLHPLIDQSEMPSDSVADAHKHDEMAIDGLTVTLRDAMNVLPDISADMQYLLKSSWMSHYPNQAAQTVFAGENDESEGIGSGMPEHGRLPAALAALFEREQIGDGRHPRAALLRDGEPRRHDMESRQRWVEQNSHFLRTAGRVD